MKFLNYDPETVAMRLRDLRDSFGYSREEAAALLSIDSSYLRHLENGTKLGSIDIYIRLTDLYHVSLDYLLTGKRNVDDETRRKLGEILDQLEDFYQSLWCD